jgi:serine/threonine-protein kinase
LALACGTRVGVYEITAQIGAGGMGEVYRARDTKLHREVALKIVPDAFVDDQDRLARFRREAQVLASLNHPHIGAIYGFEDSGETHALVLELVEGETLADRIARGAIPLDEALAWAREIAEALEAAHEQGIIHRDLKPANIKVTPDGVVKVLDFGLAKLTDGAQTPAPDLSLSPTITSPAMMTGVGMLIGTAAYMAPEQAKGRPADKRSDVWAFGCIVYEMLTGRRTFDGDDMTEVLGAVVRLEPNWDALSGDVPQPVRTLLQRCLVKDRRKRIGDIAAALFVLDHQAGVAATSAASVAPLPRRPLWKRALPVVATAVVVFALTAGAMWRLRPSVPAPVMRFAIALPDGQQLTPFGRAIAMSPAGTHIVYLANRRLYLRSLSDLEVRPITGGAAANDRQETNPVFSPDGRSIVYFEQGDRTIKRIALSGGAAVTVCEADTILGMSWDGDTIFFGQGSKGIMRVSAIGGKPETVASVNAGELAHGPQLLPDGQTLLFTLATGTAADRWDKARIVAESLTSHERKTLIDGGSDAHYLPTGHLVYALGGVLFALPFDVERMTTSGGAVPIVEGVRRTAGVTGSAQFGISNTGSLVYVPGPVSTTGGQMSLGLFDRKGGSELLKILPGTYQLPRMSPDGKRIAFGIDDGKEASIWIYELSGTSSMRRLTFEGQGHNRFPVWTADSQRVAFQSDREGDQGIFWQRADGAGTAERLTKADEGVSHIPESWAPDGERFLYNAGKGGATSLWVFSLKDRKSARFDAVESPARTLTGAVFSPNGRWVAYASQEGRASSAVYVQPFPPTGVKYQISKNADGGHHPMWSPDSAELLFQGPSGSLNAVRITTQPSFTVGEAMSVPRPFQGASTNFERPYDISRDGQHFLGLIEASQTQSGAPATQQIQVVLNWFEELKARVPSK